MPECPLRFLGVCTLLHFGTLRNTLALTVFSLRGLNIFTMWFRLILREGEQMSLYSPRYPWEARPSVESSWLQWSINLGLHLHFRNRFCGCLRSL